jgi:hypothetical protein
VESLLWTLAIGAANDPKLGKYVLGTFLAASFVRNVVVLFWPKYDERPKVVRVVMAIAEPLALNIPKALAMKLQGATDPNPPLKEPRP